MKMIEFGMIGNGDMKSNPRGEGVMSTCHVGWRRNPPLLRFFALKSFFGPHFAIVLNP